MKPIKCKLFSNIKKPSKSESTHQGEHKCVVPELLALHLTNDLYKNAGKGGHLIGVEVSHVAAVSRITTADCSKSL